MSACRPFSEEETFAVLESFSGPLAARDRALFVFGRCTGFRISEICSLRLGDLFENGRLRSSVRISSRRMKGRAAARTVPLNQVAKDALLPWISRLNSDGFCSNDSFVFRAARGGNRPISRQRAYLVIKRAAARAGVFDRIGTHSMRKSFARDAYRFFKANKPGEAIRWTAKALGHRSIQSTESYLESALGEVDEAVLSQRIIRREFDFGRRV